jgi:hypothetical protein
LQAKFHTVLAKLSDAKIQLKTVERQHARALGWTKQSLHAQRPGKGYHMPLSTRRLVAAEKSNFCNGLATEETLGNDGGGEHCRLQARRARVKQFIARERSTRQTPRQQRFERKFLMTIEGESG